MMVRSGFESRSGVLRVVSPKLFSHSSSAQMRMMIQSGYMPTVLQQLCNLPFPYFSNPELSSLLFPTLLACCSSNEKNRDILEQEVSYQLLEDFRASETGRNNRLVQILDQMNVA
uniref:Uncharacterized protein n=1 Tax=Timema genevievae TaxID=629358 RepID=A0A7R9PNJ4_TIMGE|nr:unnamed protein product [Timema genevievae]